MSMHVIMIFFFLIILALSAFTLLAWRDLKFALAVLTGLTPTYLVRFSLGPIPTTMLECFLLLALVFFFIRHGKTYRPKLARMFTHRPFTLRSFAIGALGIASILSIFIAPDMFSALGIWKAYYLEPFLFGIMIWTMFDRKAFRNALLFLCVSAIAIALFAVIQVLFSVGIPSAWAMEHRATSFFPYPNAVGLFLAPIVAALVAFAMNSTVAISQKVRTGMWIVVAILFVAIGLAKTEAALVAIPAALYVVMLMSPAFSARKKQLVTGVGAFVIASAIVLFPSIATKLTLHDTSGLVRRAQWSETLHLLADHPYLGVGLNGYPTALVPYHDASTYEIFQYPHTIVLNVWSELGVLGLIGFLGIVVFIFHYAWANKKDPWVLACFAALLTMLIHGLVDVPFMKNDLALLAVLFFAAMIAPHAKPSVIARRM